MKVLVFLLAICSVTNAVKFNCTFSVITHAVVGERYTCNAGILDYEQGQELTEVTGTHLLGRNNSNVVAVTINTQNALTFIPQAIHNFFPLIGALTIYNCNLTVLNEYDLQDYSNLEYVSFHYNRITRIPSGFFENTPRMRYMNFNYNQIKHVGENTIEPLFSLNHALFSGNSCINYSVTNSSFICLIGFLRVYCQDLDYETITTTTDLTAPTQTTTTPEPVCNMHDSVCNIENQNYGIKESIERMTEMIEQLLYILTP